MRRYCGTGRAATFHNSIPCELELARITFFGNTNNYPFLLVTGLRRLGHDARLVVNQVEPLHRPEAADPELATGYPNWVHDCSHLPESDFIAESTSIVDTVNFMAASDYAILNHIGPSLASRLSLPHLALLTGSDVTYYANPATLETRSRSWSPRFLRSPGGMLEREKWSGFIARQRSGIAAARAVSFPPQGWVPEADRLLREIGIEDERRFSVFVCDTLALRYGETQPGEKLRILNGARVNWKKPLPAGFTTQDDKVTDVLIRGFAQFLKRGGKAELRMVRKGLHVTETQELVRSLDMDRSITWLDEMELNNFRDEMRRADIVCDQFGPSFPAMTAFEAMALGKPVLGNFPLDWFSSEFGDVIPVCQAATAEEVAQQLQVFADDPHRMKTVGLAAHKFATKHLSPEANAAKCLARLGF
jgi:glycosyltransferase involved in cell wall biosynthesis